MEALNQYIRAYGPTRFAKAVGVTAGAVSHWLEGRRRPSPKQLAAIEKVTGIPRQKIRPDLYA